MDRPARTDPLERFGQPPPLSFELLAEIATGPTARVELCRIRAPNELAGKLVAVKRLHPHIAEDPQFYSMFVDEVWMTAAVDHPNVTHVVSWGTDGEGTYLAVELVEGVSLARLMKTVFETREQFSERMVVYLGSEMCAGLSAAHGLRAANGEHLNLVHRDLTPGNVLLGFDGRVLIADFGLAKAKQRVTKTLTGLLKGHPHYMAPEQATDAPIDGRADLFSLGVVLFELFTGRHPWSGGSELEVFHVMAKQPPEDILALRPKLDPELAAVVARLLDKNPANRFGSAEEVQQRLYYWLDAHGYKDDNLDAVARFVRRNAMRQMRWFERAVAGEFVSEATRAKSRLMGARARTRPAGQLGQAGQAGPAAPAGQPTSLTARSAATPPPALRRRNRKIADESTDVSDIGARIDPPAPSGETPDWGEEIPTVVKPNLQVKSSIAAANAARVTVKQGRTPEPDVESLPSFADDESDNRTTSVKPRIRFDKKTLQQPPKHDTVLDMPIVDQDTEEDDEEDPTSPARLRPKLPDGLAKLPPPPRTLTSGAELPRPERPSARPKGPRETSRLPRTEGELMAEVDRLGQQAARLRAEADRTAKLAAHRAVLAQLGAEAAQVAIEAGRALSTQGQAQALALISEAFRLEDSVARGEVQAMALGGPEDGPGPVEPERPSAPPPPDSDMNLQTIPLQTQSPVAQQRISSGPASARAPASMPFPQPPMTERVQAPATERGSFIPPARMFGLNTTSPGTNPSRKEPTAPSTRYIEPARTEDLRAMLAGEVFGVRVPVALAAAFLIALAMVVLVWIVVA